MPVRESGIIMDRKIIHTYSAPGAVGTYNQAVQAHGFIYTSGQVGLVPATGELIDGGTKAEAIQVLKNIRAILEAAGSSLSDIMKLTVYIVDISEFSQINGAFQEFFGNIDFPARSTVEVSALPIGARIEIDCVALAGE